MTIHAMKGGFDLSFTIFTIIIEYGKIKEAAREKPLAASFILVFLPGKIFRCYAVEVSSRNDRAAFYLLVSSVDLGDRLSG